MSEQSLRLGGTIAVAAGVLVVWLAKGQNRARIREDVRCLLEFR